MAAHAEIRRDEGVFEVCYAYFPRTDALLIWGVLDAEGFEVPLR